MNNLLYFIPVRQPQQLDLILKYSNIYLYTGIIYTVQYWGLNHYGGSVCSNLWVDYKVNSEFDLINLTIGLIINNSTKNHQNLINQCDFWNRRTLIMMRFYFLLEFTVGMTHLSMNFNHIWTHNDYFHWKLEMIRSLSFMNFTRSRK